MRMKPPPEIGNTNIKSQKKNFSLGLFVSSNFEIHCQTFSSREEDVHRDTESDASIQTTDSFLTILQG